MKISPHPQGSVEWSIARAGIPTASEFDQLFTSDMEPRKGAMPTTYLHKKLSEKWRGGPLASLNTFDMEQGKVLEEQAVPWFEMETGLTVQRVGLCTTDDGRVGASPDGLIDDIGGIEIKCPAIHTHVGYLLAGKIPNDYIPQVNGCLWVTGRVGWEFLSYSMELPKLRLRMISDSQTMSRIGQVLGEFLARFDAAWAQLCDANGGEPKRNIAPSPMPKAQFISDLNDIIP